MRAPTASWPVESCGGEAPQAFAAKPSFQLRGHLRQLRTEGCRAQLPAGPMASFGRRVEAFFAAPAASDAPLVGVLPFDPEAHDALLQPARLLTGAMAPTRTPAAAAQRPDACAEPSVRAWSAGVARCIAGLADPDAAQCALRKVVLARSLRLLTAQPVDLQALLQRLGSDPDVTTYLAPLPVAADEAPAWLVGATPELLISRRGGSVLSNPLAGSAPRAPDAGRDRAAADELYASGKNQAEHRYVVEAILDTLAPLCRQLHAPSRPSLQATRSMWHLGTRIEGRLKRADTSVATLAGALHPTPAVCGTPRDRALATIRELEPLERGFYAGAVGWVDAAGDGDWYVSLRCARVQARSVRLFAGAGIVAGSQPQAEVAETEAKFSAMLDALGVSSEPLNEAMP